MDAVFVGSNQREEIYWQENAPALRNDVSELRKQQVAGDEQSGKEIGFAVAQAVGVALRCVVADIISCFILYLTTMLCRQI